MKSISHYIALPYRLEITPDAETTGFIASYPDLSGCIAFGSTVGQAIQAADVEKRKWITKAVLTDRTVYEPELTVRKRSDQIIITSMEKSTDTTLAVNMSTLPLILTKRYITTASALRLTFNSSSIKRLLWNTKTGSWQAYI